MLVDNHGRVVNYLRLAVTDKCNLRCFYCMPEEGVQWLKREELMSYEELLRVSALLVRMGVEKIRITGGEPFVRKDIMQFLHGLKQLDGLKELNITTNGVLTAPLVPELKKLGVKSVNLSLDTLDRNRFFAIARRDEFMNVMETLEQLLKHGMDVKINAVVMEGRNTEDILPMVEMTKDLPVSVRFIEEMPFNGTGTHYPQLKWDHIQILNTIRQQYPTLQKIQDPASSTSYNYQVPGHKGTIGIIAAYTRSFCGTCNRLRITPQGMLKTCLYDAGVLNLRDMIRVNDNDEEVQLQLLHAISNRAKNGWEAEKVRKTNNPIHESMTTIGG